VVTVQDRNISAGVQLHIREWTGTKRPFVLVHGLASNSHTWDMAGALLAAAGHQVIAVDQRGHGLSEKPDSGYDFVTVTDDLYRLIEALGLKRPIVVGQSWGGNVVLEFGVRYPGVAAAFGWVDGGFIHLSGRQNGDWESTLSTFTPPGVIGTPRPVLKQQIQTEHPDWDERGIEGMLACYETLPDGTVRPWLTLERHLQIVRALWEQDPPALYPQLTEPVLVCPADQKKSPPDAEWLAMVEEARAGLKNAEIHWFENTDHDIHMHRPVALAELFLRSLNKGLWKQP
jgi:pimeloyl-ACP methyl ester carboxylesterase